jgi:hypothetical protein
MAWHGMAWQAKKTMPLPRACRAASTHMRDLNHYQKETSVAPA